MAGHYLAHDNAPLALATLEAGRQALAVQQSPESAPLLADLAERYVAADRNAEAILALREACEADAHGHSHHVRLGALLRRQGSATKRSACCSTRCSYVLADGAALYELAQCLENLDRVDEAWSALQQAALTRPEAAEPYLDLGRLTLAQVRKGRAERLAAASHSRACATPLTARPSWPRPTVCWRSRSNWRATPRAHSKATSGRCAWRQPAPTGRWGLARYVWT